MPDVRGRKIAVLATDGVEQAELIEPVRALKKGYADVTVIAPKLGQIQAMHHHDKGEKIAVDHDLSSVSAEAFDALVLPGGVANPDLLRADPRAVSFVRHFIMANKPIAAICHAPWTLIEADGVRNRRMTSWPSLQTDLRNAGAQWQDKEVVRDGMMVTSRKPDDLPAFCREMLQLFGASALSRA